MTGLGGSGVVPPPGPGDPDPDDDEGPSHYGLAREELARLDDAGTATTVGALAAIGHALLAVVDAIDDASAVDRVRVGLATLASAGLRRDERDGLPSELDDVMADLVRRQDEGGQDGQHEHGGRDGADDDPGSGVGRDG